MDQTVLNKIEIIQPISEFEYFETPNEFNIYYNNNKEILDKTTTHKLNKLINIKDHKIGRVKGKIILKKESNNTITRRLEHLENIITEYEIKLNTLINNYNVISDILQEKC